MDKRIFLRAAEILAVPDLVTEEVEVPEWETWVRVRSLTGIERDNYESQLYIQRGKDVKVNLFNARARLVVLCVVDEEGKRLFGDADIKTLGNKNASALERISEVARRLAGLSREDLEELTKNSEETPDDGSASG